MWQSVLIIYYYSSLRFYVLILRFSFELLNVGYSFGSKAFGAIKSANCCPGFDELAELHRLIEILMALQPGKLG